MSRRTFKPTAAFQKKEEQLRKDVLLKTLKKLANDVKKLFKDPQFYDVMFESGSFQLPLHSFIVEARCPELYEYIREQPDALKIKLATKKSARLSKFESWTNTLYSSDKIDCALVRDLFHLETSKTSDSLSKDLSSLLIKSGTADVEIKVAGKSVMAHKAILASRCDYFNAMFQSSWREATQHQFEIPDVSYDLFLAVLNFMYAADHGILTFPACDVMRFADMYGMHDMMEVIMAEIRITKCHFFHKPCQYCIPQVFECLKSCENFIQTERFRQECIRWLSKHYPKTLASRHVTHLSEHLKDSLREEIAKNLAKPSTVAIEWIKLNKLKASLKNVNTTWTKVVLNFVEELRDECVHFIVMNFQAVCELPNVSAFLKEANFSSSFFETFLLEILDMLTVANCCNIHQGLQHIVQRVTVMEECEHHLLNAFDEECLRVVRECLTKCEKFIIGRVGPVSQTKAWADKMPQSKQKELKNLAFFVDL